MESYYSIEVKNFNSREHLLQVVSNAWILKLRDMRKKKLPTPDQERVSPDLGPFLSKPASRNPLRTQSPNQVFSPVRACDTGFGEPRCSSPINHKVFDIPYPWTSPSKNLMRTPSPRRTSTPPHPRSTQSESTHATLGCGGLDNPIVTSFVQKLLGEEATVPKMESFSTGSFRKTAPRSYARENRTLHANLDLDVNCLLVVDDSLRRVDTSLNGNTQPSCAKTADKWVKEDLWSEELSKGALVKQLKKKQDTLDAKRKILDMGGRSPSVPPTIINVQQNLTRRVSRWIARVPEEVPGARSFWETPDAIDCTSRRLVESFIEENAEEKEKLPSWGSFSSLDSDESIFTTSFELPDPKASKMLTKNRWSTPDSSGVTSTGEMDRTKISISISDDKALESVDQTANLLKAGSRFSREQNIPKSEQTASDHIENYCLSDVFEEVLAPLTDYAPMESDSGSFSRSQISPKSAVYNSPVCPEEATAKTWAEIDFPIFETVSEKFSGSFDMTRENTVIGSKPFEHTSPTANARREVRRAKRLADIEALATAQRKSASRQKGNKSDGDMRRRKSQDPEPRNYPRALSGSGKDEKGEVMKQQKPGHERKWSKEELVTCMPREVNGVVKESVALVKSSYNPYNDFRESMIEMILEKDIQESSDLEELLQCYLSLNGEDYHNVIVEVFTEVWREIFEKNV